MAAIFIGYVSLKRNSLRLFLFGSGVVLAIVGNIGRSLYLSLMAHWRGVESIEKVHDAAGWSVLAFTAAGVILLSMLIGKAEQAVHAATMAEADLEPEEAET
jgi:exosortase/archaeosortase family protein